MKRKILFLLIIFNVFAISKYTYGNRYLSSDSTKLKTSIDFKMQWFEVFDNNDFGQSLLRSNVGNFNSWGFVVFFGGLPLGPTVTNLKGEIGYFETLDSVLYYRSGILNKMIIGVAAKIPIGTISFAFINEHTFFEIDEIGIPASKRIDRYGLSLSADLFYRRNARFFKKTEFFVSGFYFKDKNPYASEFSVNLDLNTNVFQMAKIKNFSFSPTLGLGIKDNGISINKYPLASIGLAISFEKAKFDLLKICYQKRFGDNGEMTSGVFVEFNIDPYIFFPKFFYDF
ncbi:hypothetical protein CVU82_03375 [Candidatus Falkowbacteria bacterium HGW-Falkowbacteria-1]|jgi:hypothetical protein|uniref:Uncharacterized protein n=1 Tax=Candidatus Falkowbacteria bacterium HGW-Falkowbacteria-1 TaxID=2013768 RepID=A0A2N2E8N1_9BACT|nr:MAG: hypothetical protein CVU82_03375 [Candidatus Falkowbacteria bacterium HGW-Falkowbacteria-1]